MGTQMPQSRNRLEDEIDPRSTYRSGRGDDFDEYTPTVPGDQDDPFSITTGGSGPLDMDGGIPFNNPKYGGINPGGMYSEGRDRGRRRGRGDYIGGMPKMPGGGGIGMEAPKYGGINPGGGGAISRVLEDPRHGGINPGGGGTDFGSMTRAKAGVAQVQADNDAAALAPAPIAPISPMAPTTPAEPRHKIYKHLSQKEGKKKVKAIRDKKRLSLQ